MPTFAARILLEAITDTDSPFGYEEFVELFHKVIPNKRVYDLAAASTDWIHSADGAPIIDYWGKFLDDSVSNEWLRGMLSEELNDEDIEYIIEEMLEFAENNIEDDDIVYKRGCSLCKKKESLEDEDPSSSSSDGEE